MKIENTNLRDVLKIKLDVFQDNRGFFTETYKESSYPMKFVQDNMSFSKKGVLRGLHFQKNNPQGKLVYVLKGSVEDVVVDLRKDSVTYGKYEKFLLTEENKEQIYIPEGFAHGFYALEDTIFCYKCTNFYDKTSEFTLRWDDSTLKIKWSEGNKIISEKDELGRSLEEIESYLLTF